MTYLVLRFSSLGNVAMAVPVIASIAQCYPEHRFVVVAKKRLQDMFYGIPNVRFHEAETPYQDFAFDRTILLDDNWRTTLDKWFNTLPFVRRNLRHETERIADVFQRHGLTADNLFQALQVNEPALDSVIQRWGTPAEGEHWIGIAPFAKHRSNMLPYRITKQVISHYAAQPHTRVFLFGAGRIECEMLQQWAGIYPGVVSVAGMLSLGEELELMRMLQVMICMDSANQHLCSLVGLRAISIWCATHPSTGFYGWNQDPEDCIEIPRLNCRPCTVHGREHCMFHNFACRQISPEQIIRQVNQRIFETT